MNQQIKLTPKDFFIHLAATIVLYTATISLLRLAFSVVDYTFPDELAGYFAPSSIAWPISMLVVLIPLLYVLEYFIIKDIKRFPEKEGVWIRRWRIYLTLFLTGAVIAGDIVVLINTYLSGEITTRFIWKFIITLVVTGIIFAYYILQKTVNLDKGRNARLTLAGVGVLITLAAIVGGFLIVGSPYKQRALRFDNQRVNDLSSIQWQVISYWQRKNMLPNSLTELKDPISGTVIPQDPETESEYEYRVTGATSFELCATFALPMQDTKGRGGFGGYPDYAISYPYPGGGVDTNWKHEAGRTCFTRTIDPELYPPIDSPKSLR